MPTLRMHVLEKFAPLLFSVAPVKCSAPDGSRATNSPKLYHGTSENNYLRSPGRSQPSGSPQTSQVSALPCCLFQSIVERALPPSRVLPGMTVDHAGVQSTPLTHLLSFSIQLTRQEPPALSNGQAQVQVHESTLKVL